MTSVRIMTRWLMVMLPAVVLGVGLMAGPASAAAESWPGNAYVLQIDGLACPYCGYGVEKQFSRQEGVKSTKINLEKGVVVVLVAPGTQFSDDKLKQIIDDAGFALGEIIQRPTKE